MPEERWVVFPTLEAARAAFTLGPVKYQCLACGKVHVSGTNRGRKCLRRLAQLCGWQPPPVPVPPAPKNLDLPYRFASAVLKGFIRDWEAARFARDLPEYLLALDPRVDIRAALKQCLDELTAQARAAADNAWETYSLLWSWLDALAECRPPCVVAAVLRSRRFEEYRDSWIARQFWLRPSVPCPVAGKEGLLAVVPNDYSHDVVNNLAWFGYGRRGFGAVGVCHVWDHLRRVVRPGEYNVLRQFYGSPPKVTRVDLWNCGPGELSDLLGEITEDLARAIEAPPVWGIANPVEGWWVVTDGCSGYLDGEGGKLPAPLPGRVKEYATRAEALAAAGGLEGYVKQVVVART